MNELSKLNKTMSSLEIAELTGKRHGDVVSDVYRILGEVEIDVTGFIVSQKYGNNNKVKTWNCK